MLTRYLSRSNPTAVVTVGYCPLARVLALMPWNRRQPLSLQIIWKTIVTPPVDGSLLAARSGD